MSIGNTFKHSFQMMLQHAGSTILVHKCWGTPQQTTSELRGLKNSEKNRPQNVMFQFPERIDVAAGDVIQQKGAQDLWRVVDVEDCVEGDVYVYFEAKMEKMSGPPKHTPLGAQIVVQGANYGGIQVSGPHSTQSMSVEVIQVQENLKHLRSLATQLPISDLEKEELGLAIDRVGQLAAKPKSEDVLAKAREKLDLIKSVFSVSKDLASLAIPYIAMIAQSVCK